MIGLSTLKLDKTNSIKCSIYSNWDNIQWFNFVIYIGVSVMKLSIDLVVYVSSKKNNWEWYLRKISTICYFALILKLTIGREKCIEEK